MKKLNLILILVLFFASCSSSKYSDLGDGIFADIQTNKGDMVVELYYQQTPITVANFISLAEGTSTHVVDSLKGTRYYDGIIFHRVIKDFMIQGGDPSGEGNGNPGYKFTDEFVDSLKHDKKGILSMANAGPGTNGSQFFITHKETPFLDGKHTVFGEVVIGLEVVDSIANVETAAKDRPVDEVVINHVEIIRNGKDARKFDALKVMDDYFAGEAEKQKELEKTLSEAAAEFEEQKKVAQSTESGLQYVVISEGNGNKPKTGDVILVHYSGHYEDGKLFDTSVLEVAEKFGSVNPEKKARGMYKPMMMEVSPDAGIIPGFKEGIMLMEEGSKYRLFIPYYLAYGEAGYGPIPPKADLVFDLEITEIQ